jgi:two-component system, OmpR family, phosphate regulon sensor histidine kinase PhoR
MLSGSLRTRLLVIFAALFVVIGTGTLVTIERTLSGDLLSTLDARLTAQGKAVATWLEGAGHPERLAPRLAQVTRTRITVVGADGLVEGDSRDTSAVGRPIGEAPEIAEARRGDVGRATRQLLAGAPPSYLVAVLSDEGRVVRLAVPLSDVHATRRRMRNRLLAGAVIGFASALLLSFLVIRAAVRPLQLMTRSAERMAQGDYDVRAPVEEGGEMGVLARAFTRLAGEVKARVEQLTEQRDLLGAVIGGLIEGVVVIDREGQAVLINDAARPLVGGELPAELSALVAKAQNGEAADGELQLRGREVRASARPLPEGALVVLYDVTQLRALESVRREFLSNAAHELRTPITAISGYAETLLSGPVDAQTSTEFLEIIHRNANRIAHLVSDLLVLDGLEARASAVGERTPVALGRVAQDAVANARAWSPDAQVSVQIDPQVVVWGTREGLDHVVQNLVDNAIKYGGAPIEITVERTKEAAVAPGANKSAPRAGTAGEGAAASTGRAARAATSGGGSGGEPTPASRVRLIVSDRGPGIPPDQQARVFERFYRLDAGRSRDKGGSGLGLAIVKSQVQALGGEIRVESKLGEGTRFIVELDAAPSQA